MEEIYFERIPYWSDSPRFIVMADEVSGRIPVTRLDDWRDFSNLLEDDFFNKAKTQFVFRGHRRGDWSLLPTLGRVTHNGIVTDDLAMQQLELFRRAVRGRLTDNTLLDVTDESDDELWSVGQHHGLMTPLLDWTYSPYVGLFFAFSKEDQRGEEDNPYRSIYVINKTFVEDNGDCPDIRLLEPRRDDHGRLVNQAGLFTFSPTDSTIENKLIQLLSEIDEFKEADENTEAELLANYICKIYIKNIDREGCIKSLRKMNVHHASLFPDLLGASDYCNLLIEEEQREYEIEKSEERIELTEEPEGFAGSTDAGDMFISDEKEVITIALLLKSDGEAKQVEPGRIQLIAETISKESPKFKVVDWTERAAARSSMRAFIRITLRKYGYPPQLWDTVIDRIINYLIEQEKKQSEAVE